MTNFPKYFTGTTTYVEPTLIKFDQPKKIKLCELHSFLDSYKPFPCCYVWTYSRMEYGDFDNYVNAIIEDITIDAGFSRVYHKDAGIYKAGETSYCLVSRFWNYRAGKAFWIKCPTASYDSTRGCKDITDIEITIDGVYVISYSDKDRMEKENQ